MNRRALVELLEVERHTPGPVHPWPDMPPITAEQAAENAAILLREVGEFEAQQAMNRRFSA